MATLAPVMHTYKCVRLKNANDAGITSAASSWSLVAQQEILHVCCEIDNLCTIHHVPMMNDVACMTSGEFS